MTHGTWLIWNCLLRLYILCVLFVAVFPCSNTTNHKTMTNSINWSFVGKTRLNVKQARSTSRNEECAVVIDDQLQRQATAGGAVTYTSSQATSTLSRVNPKTQFCPSICATPSSNPLLVQPHQIIHKPWFKKTKQKPKNLLMLFIILQQNKI